MIIMIIIIMTLITGIYILQNTLVLGIKLHGKKKKNEFFSSKMEGGGKKIIKCKIYTPAIIIMIIIVTIIMIMIMIEP